MVEIRLGNAAASIPGFRYCLERDVRPLRNVRLLSGSHFVPGSIQPLGHRLGNPALPTYRRRRTDQDAGSFPQGRREAQGFQEEGQAVQDVPAYDPGRSDKLACATLGTNNRDPECRGPYHFNIVAAVPDRRRF